MILSAGSKVRGVGLGPHLAKGKADAALGRTAGEAARPAPSRGLVSVGIEAQLAELWAGADMSRTSTPLYHVHCDPRWQDPELIAEFWRLFEEEFGLKRTRFASERHAKGDRGDHEHRVYDITSPGGKVADLRNDFYRRQKLDVVACWNMRRAFPPICHMAAVAKALKQEGRHDIAAWVEAQPRRARPVPPSPAERQAQERTGSDKGAVVVAVMAAWTVSDDGRSFAAALAAHGLALAQGDKVPVVVDGAGAAWPLGRMVGEASHAAGARIRAAAVRARLAGLDLPAEAEVRRRRREAERQAAREEEARRAAAEATRLAEAERAAEAERRSAAAIAAARAAAEAAIGALIDEGRRAVAALASLDHERSRPPPGLRSLRRTARRDRAAATAAAAARDLAEVEVSDIGTARPRGWRRPLAWLSGDLGRHGAAAAAAELRAAQARRDAVAAENRAVMAEQHRDERQKAWQARATADRATRREDLRERIEWHRAAVAAVRADPGLATAPERALRDAVRRRRAPPAVVARPGPAHMPRPR